MDEISEIILNLALVYILQGNSNQFATSYTIFKEFKGENLNSSKAFE